MPLRLWRIVAGTHAVWSGEGARLHGQRWNPPGFGVVYTGTSFATCLVEILVHTNRKTPPRTARFVEAEVPDDVSREIFDPSDCPEWGELDDLRSAQDYGRRWIVSQRSALLIVPSVVTAGHDSNVVVNLAHPEAKRISVGPETLVKFDRRLFDT